MSDFYESHLQSPDVLVPYKDIEADPLRSARGLIPLWKEAQSIPISVTNVSTPDGSPAGEVLMELVYRLYTLPTTLKAAYQPTVARISQLFRQGYRMDAGPDVDLNITSSLEETLTHGMTRLLFVPAGASHINAIWKSIEAEDQEAATAFLRCTYGHLGVLIDRITALGADSYTSRPEFMQIIEVAKWFKRSLRVDGDVLSSMEGAPEQEVLRIFIATHLTLDHTDLSTVTRLLEESSKLRRLERIPMEYWRLKGKKTQEAVQALSDSKSLKDCVAIVTAAVYQEMV